MATPLPPYTAIPCDFCQRVKIALAAKGVEYESLEIDLVRRPAWFREKASGGAVPLRGRGAS